MADMMRLGRPQNEPEPTFLDPGIFSPQKQEQKTPPTPAWEQDLQNWQRTPTPQYTTALLRHMAPTIENGLKTYGGGTNVSPMLRSQAKQLAIQAFHTYNPEKGALNTHVMHNLQRLQRLQARDANIIRIPERHMLDLQHLQTAEDDLEQTLLRPPTTHELADHTGLSPAKITKLRKTVFPVAEGSFSSDSDEDFDSAPAVEQAPHMQAAELVYDDLTDPTDRLIMEYSLGLHGRNKLQLSQLAKKLHVSPSAVSQRAAKIQALMDAVEEAGLF